jgi:hypothetical protein
MMVAFGAVFSIQVARFLNDVFRDGLVQLEQSAASEVQSGQGFVGP